MASKLLGTSRGSDKPLSRRVLVEIFIDMTAKTSKVVWQHEVPIIEAVFGEGKVKVLDPTTLDEGYTEKLSPAMLPHNKKQDSIARPSECMGIGFAFIGNPRAEYDRLASAYGKLAEENILAVEKVYGRAQDGRFAQITAGATLEDLPEAQLRSLIEAYGFAPAGANKDMPDAEKTTAAAALLAFRTADRADLLKLATEAGVELN